MKNLELFCETVLNVKNLLYELEYDEGMNMHHIDCKTFSNLCDHFCDCVESIHKEDSDDRSCYDTLIDILKLTKDFTRYYEEKYNDIENAWPLIKAFNSLLDIEMEYFKEL